jgi:glycosyltransferase involved in cell wall biosynthesis
MRDFELALAAVADVRRRGRPLRLVHTGEVLDRLDRDRLARLGGLEDGALDFRGYVSPEELDRLLREAAVLLQPGAPSDYNRLRLPSKLQAYLASGTPTITFAVGAGELLEDGREALLTRTGDAAELAERILRVLDDPGVAAALGEGGRAAAARLFDRERNTDALVSHYRSVLEGEGRR